MRVSPEMSNINNAPSRRGFLRDSLAATASISALGWLQAHGAEPQAKAKIEPPKITRKVKIGIIGGGHRGNLIGNFMKEHGGYEIHAVADYFPEVVQTFGNVMGVDKSRQFSGLSGYKKVIDTGVEALAILVPPCFSAEHATAAAHAGCHVYVAKPVAVDVPGCLSIEAAAKTLTEKKRCFLVDYQFPLDPANIDVAKRIHDGAIGSIAHILSFGCIAPWDDPPKGPTIASRLQHWVWCSDIALSGDSIVSYDIHVIDPVTRIMGKRVASACGRSRICRPEPHGDRIDAGGVVFEYDNGVLWTHVLQAIKNNADFTTLTANFFGMTAMAHLGYSGKTFVRGGKNAYSGKVSSSIYNDGPQRNVADFYKNVTEGHFENPTAKIAVDGTLSAILGREASAQSRYMTMDELLRENKKLKVDLAGMAE